MPLTASDIPDIPLRPLIAVGSGVSDQPWSAEEAARGAINRARGALQSAGADIGVGLEGGVEEGPGGLLYLSGWGAIATANGRLGLGGGGRTLLPPELADMLRSGVELGPAIDAWLGRKGVRHQEGTVGVLTGGYLERAASFAHLLQHALAAILHPEWFADLIFSFEDDLA